MVLEVVKLCPEPIVRTRIPVSGANVALVGVNLAPVLAVIELLNALSNEC